MKFAFVKILVPVLTIMIQFHAHNRSHIGSTPFSFGVNEARADGDGGGGDGGGDSGGDGDDGDDGDGGDDGNEGQAAVDAANCAAQAGISTAQSLGLDPGVGLGIAATAYGALSPGVTPEGVAAAVGPAATAAAIGFGVDPGAAAAIGNAMSAAALSGCDATS